MNDATISLGTIAVGELFIVLSVAITLAVFYAASGEWLWEKEKKKGGRNWQPPR